MGRYDDKCQPGQDKEGMCSSFGGERPGKKEWTKKRGRDGEVEEKTVSCISKSLIATGRVRIIG